MLRCSSEFLMTDLFVHYIYNFNFYSTLILFFDSTLKLIFDINNLIANIFFLVKSGSRLFLMRMSDDSGEPRRCQFHQRFTCVFFVRKSFFRQNITREKYFRTKNARVKHWWNWIQVESSGNVESERGKSTRSRSRPKEIR